MLHVLQLHIIYVTPKFTLSSLVQKQQTNIMHKIYFSQTYLLNSEPNRTVQPGFTPNSCVLSLLNVTLYIAVDMKFKST